MIGMVLAAGAGRRLGEDTAALPKTLLGVDGDRTILDVALGNFASVGLAEAVIVTGFAAERIDERLPAPAASTIPITPLPPSSRRRTVAAR